MNICSIATIPHFNAFLTLVIRFPPTFLESYYLGQCWVSWMDRANVQWVELMGPKFSELALDSSKLLSSTLLGVCQVSELSNMVMGTFGSRFFSKTIIFSLEKIQTMFINPFFPGEWHQIFHWFRMCLSWGNFSIHTLFHFWNPCEEQVPRNPLLRRDFAVTREISKRGPTSSFFQTLLHFYSFCL